MLKRGGLALIYLNMGTNPAKYGPWENYIYLFAVVKWKPIYMITAI